MGDGRVPALKAGFAPIGLDTPGGDNDMVPLGPERDGEFHDANALECYRSHQVNILSMLKLAPIYRQLHLRALLQPIAKLCLDGGKICRGDLPRTNFLRHTPQLVSDGALRIARELQPRMLFLELVASPVNTVDDGLPRIVIVVVAATEQLFEAWHVMVPDIPGHTDEIERLQFFEQGCIPLDPASGFCDTLDQEPVNSVTKLGKELAQTDETNLELVHLLSGEESDRFDLRRLIMIAEQIEYLDRERDRRKPGNSCFSTMLADAVPLGEPSHRHVDVIVPILPTKGDVHGSYIPRNSVFVNTRYRREFPTE